MITYREGDLFASGLRAIAHGVNCEGVMGAGIAVGFRDRYPRMYESYRRRCLKHELLPGEIHVWHHPGGFVFNLATQRGTGPDAKPWMITAAVGQMISEAHYDFGITEIGLPMIGTGIGGITQNELRRALAPYADAPVDLTVFEYVVPGTPPRCDYGHGDRDWCGQEAAWLHTWECPRGHLTYRRLCAGHDPGLPAARVPSGSMCGFTDAGGMCTQPATMISRTKPQR
jgi:O-acetyl-ADP-ribose deacetylase (regulator of RNase III)